MKIYLVRHAEANVEVAKISDSYNPSLNPELFDLTDKGINQAKQVAMHLHSIIKEKPLVVSSPLPFTKKTAEYIASEFKTTYDDELGKFFRMASMVGGKVAESSDSIYTRVLDGLASLILKNQTSIVISHSSVIGAFLKNHFKCDYVLGHGESAVLDYRSSIFGLEGFVSS